jgi:hypothetical protein
MNKIKIAIIISVSIIVCAVTVWAASYDSAEDPLVTLSYIANVFKPQIDSSISTSTEALKNEIAELRKTVDALKSASAQTVQPSSLEGYEVLYLYKGETILAREQCEMILRAGEAAVVSPFAEQGIADITEGMDILANTSITKNHCLLVPRGGDGRGVTVTSDTAYIMVRGKYDIVKP